MRTHGLGVDDVLASLAGRQAREPDVHAGSLFGLVYPSGRPDVEALVEEVSRRYLFGNALNPFRFPELAALERDVVASVAALVNHPGADELPPGVMTSGGSESILMAMLVHRQRAFARGVERPQIVAPASAHPAYAKAAHYLGMDLVRVPLDESRQASAAAAAGALGERTAVLVASAFCYPYGVMDPVAALAEVAAGAGAGCHVDACIGGFVLPFLERLGRPVPPYDFRVPGVTSMSVDIHKYGYVPKGASVVLHRDTDWAGHQIFLYDDWGAGLYGAGAVAGARPAAPIACSWAVINHLGLDGYTAIVRDLMATTDRFRAAASLIDGVEVVGDPIGPVLALRSDDVDLHAVADAMDERGWHLNRNTDPRGVHLMLSPAHAAVVDRLLADLEECVRHPPAESNEGAARYAGPATTPGAS